MTDRTSVETGAHRPARAPWTPPPLLLGVAYLSIVVAPLALAAAELKTPRPVLDELASGAGLLAFAVILSEFLLSGRLKTVSRGVGMDTTMRLHRQVARGALVLALLHPFLYTLPFRPPYPFDPDRSLTVTVDIVALGSGMAAFVLLPAFVVHSIYRSSLPWRYEVWRLMHGLGALVIAALLLHHALEAGRYSAEPALAGLWIALFAVAVASLLFVYVAKPLAQLRRPWRVQDVRAVAERTWELTLTPDGHDGLAYEAGQFAWVNVGHSPFSLYENPFSISSAPGVRRHLQFIIKEFGDFSGSVEQVPAGTRAWIDGPHGNLVITGRREPGIALIAGGVGIAALIGILRDLRATGDPRPTMLIYGNRTESQIVHRAELDACAREHGTRVEHVLQEPPPGWQGRTGLIDRALIAELFDRPGMRDWLVVLCGPTPMILSVEESLSDLGVPAGQILSERFEYD